MQALRHLQISLSEEMADQLRARIASGHYADESDVIREGLEALDERDRAVDSWLREDVAPAYDAFKADPSCGRSLDDVMAALAAERERLAKPR